MADYFDPAALLVTTGAVARATDFNAAMNALNTSFAAVQSGIQNRGDSYALDTGAEDVYLAEVSPAPVAYTTGMEILVKIVNVNTGASTINLNSLGVKNIKRLDGSALLAGDLPADGVVKLVYDGTNFQIADNGSPSYSLSGSVLTITNPS